MVPIRGIIGTEYSSKYGAKFIGHKTRAEQVRSEFIYGEEALKTSNVDETLKL